MMAKYPQENPIGLDVRGYDGLFLEKEPPLDRATETEPADDNPMYVGDPFPWWDWWDEQGGYWP